MSGRDTCGHGSIGKQGTAARTNFVEVQADDVLALKVRHVAVIERAPHHVRIDRGLGRKRHPA